MILSQKLNEKSIRKMSEESYIVSYSIILSQKLNAKSIRQLNEESYIILYSLIFSQKLIKKKLFNQIQNIINN